MASRNYKPLDGIDLTVARALRLGMDSGTFLQIEYIYGFELFGSYETFRGGWRVTDPQVKDTRIKADRQLVVEAERLEDAINKWAMVREQCKQAAG